MFCMKSYAYHPSHNNTTLTATLAYTFARSLLHVRQVAAAWIVNEKCARIYILWFKKTSFTLLSPTLLPVVRAWGWWAVLYRAVERMIRINYPTVRWINRCGTRHHTLALHRVEGDFEEEQEAEHLTVAWSEWPQLKTTGSQWVAGRGEMRVEKGIVTIRTIVAANATLTTAATQWQRIASINHKRPGERQVRRALSWSPFALNAPAAAFVQRRGRRAVCGARSANR